MRQIIRPNSIDELIGPGGKYHENLITPDIRTLKAYIEELEGLLNNDRTPVLQDWVCRLTFMQQSVLITAVRGPDGIFKDHHVKVLMRWLRRSILICAFDKRAHNGPYEPCGGKFTGACPHDIDMVQYGRDYLRYVDELPHHFQLHFMHAAEIIGYKHPDRAVRNYWHNMYLDIVNDAHLHPESEEEMDKRLGDNEDDWRAREVVTAH